MPFVPGMLVFFITQLIMPFEQLMGDCEIKHILYRSYLESL